tara:strand:+ start:657 stop:935 length:279 start_codon:yes stop_codon:yes gene_type:complete
MDIISYQDSINNYQKYKDDLEYKIIIDNKYIIYENQRNEIITKKVYDNLYEKNLISKEFYIIESKKLNIQNNYDQYYLLLFIIGCFLLFIFL